MTLAQNLCLRQVKFFGQVVYLWSGGLPQVLLFATYWFAWLEMSKIILKGCKPKADNNNNRNNINKRQ